MRRYSRENIAPYMEKCSNGVQNIAFFSVQILSEKQTNANSTYASCISGFASEVSGAIILHNRIML